MRLHESEKFSPCAMFLAPTLCAALFAFSPTASSQDVARELELVPARPAEFEVLEGRAIVAGSEGPTILRRSSELHPLEERVHLELPAAARAKIVWPGRGSLLVIGPASIELGEPPAERGDELHWRLHFVGRAYAEVRRGRVHVATKYGWELELETCAVEFTSRPDESLEARLQAGRPTAAHWMGDARRARPPVFLDPGSQALLADPDLMPTPVDRAAQARPWSEVEWPWPLIRRVWVPLDEIEGTHVSTQVGSTPGAESSARIEQSLPVRPTGQVDVRPLRNTPGGVPFDAESREQAPATGAPGPATHSDQERSDVPQTGGEYPRPNHGSRHTEPRSPHIAETTSSVDLPRNGAPATDGSRGPVHEPSSHLGRLDLPSAPTSSSPVTSGPVIALPEPRPQEGHSTIRGHEVTVRAPELTGTPADPPVEVRTEPAPNGPAPVEEGEGEETPAHDPTAWHDLEPDELRHYDTFSFELDPRIECLELLGDRFRLSLPPSAPKGVWVFGLDQDALLSPGAVLLISSKGIFETYYGNVAFEARSQERP